MDFLCEDFAWGYLPWDLAAISSYYLGEVEEARIYGTTALDLDPENPRLLANMKFYTKEN
jgi:Flp pilus assembly protein TadD